MLNFEVLVSYRIVFASFSPDLKSICFRNAFLRIISGFIRITFTDLGLGPDILGIGILFVLVSSFHLFLATCARLS